MNYLEICARQVQRNLISEQDLIRRINNSLFERKIPSRNPQFKIIMQTKLLLKRPIIHKQTLRIYDPESDAS